MVAQPLDGKACAASVEEELHERIAACISAGVQPHLAVVIVGDDPASHVYVNSKVKACEATWHQEHAHRTRGLLRI